MLLVIGATERELAAIDVGETLVCGVGPVEAAAATARALAERRPAALLHVGIAGAVSLAPPAVVIGSEAVYCDLAGQATTIPLVERASPAPELVAAARRALPDAPVLPIGTSARVGGGHAVEVEAMEGFAVLRAAELAGVPALELRAVSNLVAEADRSRWRFEDAFAALADATRRVARELGR